MKSTLLVITLLISQTWCFSQKLDKGGPEKSGFYQEIPYQEINGKIIIPVEIAGKPHQFLLDTGAPFTVSEEIAAELGINAGKQITTADAYGNTAAANTATLKSIKIGEVNFKDIPAMIGTNSIYQCLGVDGNIGSNLLRHTIISFNSAKKVIVFTDDASKLQLKADNGISMNIKKDKTGSPYFVLNTGEGVTGDYYIDTGDSGFLSLSKTYYEIFKAHGACSVLSIGYGSNSFGQNGAENSNVKYRVLFPKVKIGPSVFTNVKAETVFNASGSGNNSIGTKLLDYGVLTLDYLHGKLYFDAFKPETDLTEKNWPLSPGFTDGKFTIGVVWGQMKDVVKPGLQIMAIDGTSYERIELCTLMKQKSILQDKTHATLTIRGADGKISKIKMDKQ